MEKLSDVISSFKDEQVLALCGDDTFHVQFVERVNTFSFLKER